MSTEVQIHVDWRGETHLIGRLFAAECSPAVSFEYDAAWLACPDRFALDPFPCRWDAECSTLLRSLA